MSNTMMKTIKITPRQYQLLKEATEDNFTYGISDDAKTPHDAQQHISVNGNIKYGTANAEKNTTSDEIGRIETPQFFYNRCHYGNIATVMREGVDISNTKEPSAVGKEDNTADDIGETDAFDSQELEDSTIIQIPQTVKDRVNLLKQTINQAHLSPKQDGVVLNDLVKSLTSNSTTLPMQKKLDKEIQKDQKNTFQMRKNTANND